MDNLKLPAYTRTYGEMTEEAWRENSGFTKLELASLMIAQRLVSKYNLKTPEDQKTIADLSVELATEVLQSANK